MIRLNLPHRSPSSIPCVLLLTVHSLAAILAVNSIGRKERSEWVRSVRALPPPHRTLPPLPFQWVVFTSFTYPLFTVPSSLHSINKWTWRAFHSPTVHIINEWEGRETTNLDSPLVLVSSIIPWSWCLSSLLSLIPFPTTRMVQRVSETHAFVRFVWMEGREERSEGKGKAKRGFRSLPRSLQFTHACFLTFLVLSEPQQMEHRWQVLWGANQTQPCVPFTCIRSFSHLV